jgi:acetylglutamate kinase
VIAPVSADAEGTTFNINADEAAVATAAALAAEKLIFLTDVPGILRDAGDPESLLSELGADEARRLIEEGVISGGMIPKTEAALRALAGGAGTVHIIDGTLPHAILLEVFTEEGIGTKITKEPTP